MSISLELKKIIVDLTEEKQVPQEQPAKKKQRSIPSNASSSSISETRLNPYSQSLAICLENTYKEKARDFLLDKAKSFLDRGDILKTLENLEVLVTYPLLLNQFDEIVEMQKQIAKMDFTKEVVVACKGYVQALMQNKRPKLVEEFLEQLDSNRKAAFNELLIKGYFDLRNYTKVVSLCLESESLSMEQIFFLICSNNQLKNYKAAIEIYDSRVENNLNNVYMSIHYLYALISDNQLEKALKEGHALLENYGNQISIDSLSQIYYWLGMAEEKKQNKEQSIVLLLYAFFNSQMVNEMLNRKIIDFLMAHYETEFPKSQSNFYYDCASFLFDQSHFELGRAFCIHGIITKPSEEMVQKLKNLLRTFDAMLISIENGSLLNPISIE